jgi:hypothetical protein
MGIELAPELLREVVNPWLLGADPEFAVLDPPDKLILNSGTYATESNTQFGGIGQDHSGRVWEVRPAPSTSSYGVVTNIWRLLRSEHLKKVEQFKWKGGALGAKKGGMDDGALAQAVAAQLGQHVPIMNPAPTAVHDTLGGHIHFGITGFNPAQKVALDKVTTGLLNLEILPRKENELRLRYGAYGRFNHDAVRICDNHVEYRCAPSWLDKPGQAFAALTAYKLAGAKPSSIDWTEGFAVKKSFLEWIAEFAHVDVDAFLLDKFIERRGFEAIQADPESNFRPRWRKEELWAR